MVDLWSKRTDFQLGVFHHEKETNFNTWTARTEGYVNQSRLCNQSIIIQASVVRLSKREKKKLKKQSSTFKQNQCARGRADSRTIDVEEQRGLRNLVGFVYASNCLVSFHPTVKLVMSAELSRETLSEYEFETRRECRIVAICNNREIAPYR